MADKNVNSWNKFQTHASSREFLDRHPKLLKRQLRAPYWAGHATQVG